MVSIILGPLFFGTEYPDSKYSTSRDRARSWLAIIQ